MSGFEWSDVVASITPLEPTDLDALIDKIAPKTGAPARTQFPTAAAIAAVPTSFEDDQTVCFGARVTKDTANVTALAMTLAQLAAEKGGVPIILSHLDYCGLEQFGFRVERVAGQTEEEIAACEAQICAFWKIVMVI